MKIKKIILSNYKRLFLSNINYLEYTPDKNVQLILGTNGSGKSSLINELFPIAPDYRHFKIPGYRKLYIEHRNDQYELITTFNEKNNTYEFIKNGEELNKGKTTITSFNELVKREFCLDEDIRDLFLGTTSFCNMSSTDRKSWISKLSILDFNYAYAVYKRISTELRDKQGSLKINQNRLAQENFKLLSKEEIISLEKETKELKYLLEKVLENKTIVYETKEELEENISKKNNELIILKENFFNKRKEFRNYEGFINEKEILDEINKIRVELLSIDKFKNNLFSSLEAYENTINLLDERNENISLEQNIELLVYERNELSNNLNYKTIIYNNPSSSLVGLSAIEELLINSFNKLKKTDTRYNREYYASKKTELENLINTINNKNIVLEKCMKDDDNLESISKNNLIICPNCSLEWINNYDKQKHNLIKRDISITNKLLEDLIKKKEDIEEFITDCNEHISGLKEFSSLTKNLEILNPVWLYIKDNDGLRDTSFDLFNFIVEVKEDLNTCIQIEKKNKELEELNNILNENNSKKYSNISKLKQDYKRDYKTIADYEKKSIKLKDRENKLINYIKVYKELEVIVDEAKDNNNSRISYEEKYLSSIKNDYYNSIINNLKLTISKNEEILNTNSNQLIIIDDLNNQINELEKSIHVLKASVKALSPTEGLIAKSLIDFINHIIIQINTFIKEIWTYSLELKTIDSIESFKLDYKIPFSISNNDVISDISKGSNGIKEVIDFAFKIVAMQYLNMEDYPLFIDEFGSRFDEAHKISSLQVIAKLVENSDFEQIYMISHHINSFGDSKTCDINVIDNSNVTTERNTIVNKNMILR